MASYYKVKVFNKASSRRKQICLRVVDIYQVNINKYSLEFTKCRTISGRS